MREQPDLKVEMVPVDQLTPYAGNAKKHPREQVEQIAKSIEEFGNCDPIAVWTNQKGELEIIEGHGRLYALDKLGIKECPVIFLDHLSDEQRRAYTHVHNQLTMNTGWDFEILEEEFQALPDFEWEDFGFNFDVMAEFDTEIEETKDDETGYTSLKEQFGVVPFSIIYGNKPSWMERKRAWVNLGIRSEIGRGGDLLSIAGAIHRQTSYKVKDK